MRKVRIGLVGTGGICNGPHIDGYLNCEACEITAICDIDPLALARTGDRLGIPAENRFQDYKELLSSGLVDAVDIATSNDFHVEIAMAALDAGLPVSVEKPVGISFDESKKLKKKSDETGLPVFICFSWRYMRLPRFMRHLVREGVLGNLYHIYIDYLKESGTWQGRKLEWRFQEEKAGTGVLGDLGSHMFDVIRFLTDDDMENVYCDTGILIKQRPKMDSDELGEVTTDDWANVICRMKSGISATVKISRLAKSYQNYNVFEVIGTNGCLKYVNHDGNEKLLLCVGDDLATHTFREVVIPEDFQDGNQSESFVNLVNGKRDEYAALIQEGIYTQVVIDGAKLSSELGKKIVVEEMIREED